MIKLIFKRGLPRFYSNNPLKSHNDENIIIKKREQEKFLYQKYNKLNNTNNTNNDNTIKKDNTKKDKTNKKNYIYGILSITVL